MSNVYVSEPPTTGKVIMHTSYGPLEIELWAKECPRTVSNFLQLVLDGLYDRTVFHRIVPDFCIQGGDVERVLNTDNRENKEQVLAMLTDLPKEFHSRLKFGRRGLLGAVEINTSSHTGSQHKSSLASNSNRSHPCQFFITLGPTPELNNRCTCFGKVVGESLFNALRIGEIVVEEGENPVYEVVIERIEVIINPHPNLKPRFAKKKIEVREDTKKQIPLAFSSLTANDPLEKERQAKRDALRQKIAALKEQIEGSTKKETTNDFDARGQKEQKKPMSLIERQRVTYMNKNKAIVGKRIDTDKAAQETLLSLVSFRHKLQRQSGELEDMTGADGDQPFSTLPKKQIIEICKLHGLMNCQSCRDTFLSTNNQEGINGTDQGWMMHRLVFDRAELDMTIREDLKQLVVIDPKQESLKYQQKNKTKK